MRLVSNLVRVGFLDEALDVLYETVLRPRLGGRVWHRDHGLYGPRILATSDPLRVLETIAEACPELHGRLAIPVRVGDAYLLEVV